MENITNKVGDASVTLNPSEKVAKAEVVPMNLSVTDATGRVIEVAEPDFLSQFRLTEAVGKSSGNEAYMNMIRPLLYVKSIGGQPVVPPQSKAEVESLIKRLGPDGYNALAEALVQKYSSEASNGSQVEALKK